MTATVVAVGAAVEWIELAAWVGSIEEAHSPSHPDQFWLPPYMILMVMIAPVLLPAILSARAAFGWALPKGHRLLVATGFLLTMFFLNVTPGSALVTQMLHVLSASRWPGVSVSGAVILLLGPCELVAVPMSVAGHLSRKWPIMIGIVLLRFAVLASRFQ